MAQRYLFASYARSDVSSVTPVLEAIDQELQRRGANVRVWVDVEQLQPGQNWAISIREALRKAVGLLIFVSPSSLKSDFVRRELEIVVQQNDRLILPIIIQRVAEVPAELQVYQWLDLTTPTPDAIREAATSVAEVVERRVGRRWWRLFDSPRQVTTVADAIAAEARLPPAPESVQEVAAPRSVFVAYGHDKTAVGEVTAFLRSLDVEAIILSAAAGAEQSLFQKFLTTSRRARFAVVVLSADDLGASRLQYGAEGVGDKALQFRARQNVILELGFFYGFLGWENVFVVFIPPDKVFPNFERPSDLDGVIFDAQASDTSWRLSLSEKLRKAGFEIPE